MCNNLIYIDIIPSGNQTWQWNIPELNAPSLLGSSSSQPCLITRGSAHRLSLVPYRVPGHDELPVGAGDLDPIAQDAIGFPARWCPSL